MYYGEVTMVPQGGAVRFQVRSEGLGLVGRAQARCRMKHMRPPNRSARKGGGMASEGAQRLRCHYRGEPYVPHKLVHPGGIEPPSTVPKTVVLSVELRVQETSKANFLFTPLYYHFQ